MKRTFFSIATGILTLVAAMLILGAGAGDASAALSSPGGVLQAQTGSPSQQGKAPLAPIDTTITYQGRLVESGSPANGQYDFEFRLFDALTGGNQVGGLVAISSQTVTNGTFSAPLNFGQLDGTAVWLEIKVRRAAVGSFTLLTPRQALTPAPYAVTLRPGAVINGANGSAPLLSVSNTSSNVAIQGSSNSGGTNSIGVYGSAATYGLFGRSANVGTYGISTGANDGVGVSGEAGGENGIGVKGSNPSGYGVHGTGKWGVYGFSANTGGYGVYGNTNTGGYGVYGKSSSNGYGVYGIGQWGVFGKSTTGYGVYGESSNIGTYGTATADNGSGLYGVANGNGGIGAYGTANNSNGYGVYGAGNWGVYGLGFGTGFGHGYGVYGAGDTGLYADGARYGLQVNSGVIGAAIDSDGDGMRITAGLSSYGVYVGTSNVGVYANGNVTGVTAIGYHYGISALLLGSGSNNWAGYFVGPVKVTGSCCSSGESTVQIDDPLDPANKYLNHAAVTSSDMMNIYNGNVTTDAKGEAIVTLPAWFESINKDFRYQLTAIGAPGPNLYVAEKVNNGRFKIAGSQPNSEVSWQITGSRKDPYAAAHPIQPETDKSAEDKGKYLYPTEMGQPESKGINYEQVQKARQDSEKAKQDSEKAKQDSEKLRQEGDKANQNAQLARQNAGIPPK